MFKFSPFALIFAAPAARVLWRSLGSTFGLFFVWAAVVWSSAPPPPVAPAATQSGLRQQVEYGKLPLRFEANQGQTDSAVKFLARGPGYQLHLTANAAALQLQQPATGRRAALKIGLAGAQPAASLTGLELQASRSHYLRGNDPAQWQTDVPHFAKVRCAAVYPGIDLVYYGQQQQLEYDFVVAPGADPRAIRLQFDGAEQVSINAAGELELQTAAGTLRQHAPVIYQDSANGRREIPGRYLPRSSNEMGFEIGAYDARLPLVIDPVLTYSTLLGGDGIENGYGIAVDAAGNAYVTGSTSSANFPKANALQTNYGGSDDVFVLKLNPAGNQLIYATFIGGGGRDLGLDIAVDAAGSAYVTGMTASTDFPKANALQATLGANGSNPTTDAFLLKLNPAGSALVYSTYLGGNSTDIANGLAVDGAGNAYVIGTTASSNFPTQTPLQAARNGTADDVFLTKVNAAGSALVYSTYLGGASAERGYSLAVDAAGNVYATGQTTSANFPTQAPLQAARRGASDAFVVKLNPTGSALVYATYLGGDAEENTEDGGIAVDAAGNAYLTGGTASTNFPTLNAPQATNAGGTDAFIAKLNPAGSALVYSTFIGSGRTDEGKAIAVDATGNAYVTGTTGSFLTPSFPVIGGERLAAGLDDEVFVAKLNAAGSVFVYSNYFGGDFGDDGNALALDSGGNVYLTGFASNNFPTKNPLQANLAGFFDAFITKLSADNRSTAAVTVSAASYTPTAAPEAIVALFGQGMSTETSTATATPLPTVLNLLRVRVRDSAGTTRSAPLFFVSPGQINYQVPAGTASGAANITVAYGTAALPVATGTLNVNPVAPGLFTANANGQGVPAAVVLRIKADGSQSFEAVARLDTTTNRYVPQPLDLGPATDQLFLILYGTGWRQRTALTGVTLQIGGVNAPVSFAGAQGGLVGLDQLNAQLPRSLAGRGDVDAVLTVDGQAANTIRMNIK